MAATTTFFRKLPHTKKAQQLGVSTRTLDRWVEMGVIDPPERINGRKFYPENSRPKTDEQTAA
jgi:DNA-binding transcriptional MerR regulator